MSQSHVIIEVSDAWLLDSELPAVRRGGVIYGPGDAALATQEVAVVSYKQPAHEPATTLLPVLRLPQRQATQVPTPTRWQMEAEANDLPTVVMPTVHPLADDLVTVILPAPAMGVKRNTTPTRRWVALCHYCYQCGAMIPPWREMCFAHEAHYGRGLPPPVTLQALPDNAVDLRPTLPLPSITRRQRAS